MATSRTEPRERDDTPLARAYAAAGRPYGDDRAGFWRWCDELEAQVFGADSRDPRRLAPEGAADPRRTRPQ